MNDDELKHYGILGMKWGVRRYQNKDGTLTPAGRRKANKLKEQYTELTGKRLVKKPISKISKSKNSNDNDSKSIKDMTDSELRERTTRMNLERDYINAIKTMNDLSPKQISKGKAFADKMAKDVIAPAMTDVAKQLVKSFLVKTVNDGLKLDKEHKVYTNNEKKK